MEIENMKFKKVGLDSLNIVQWKTLILKWIILIH